MASENEDRVLIDPLVANIISINAANLQKTNEKINEWDRKKIEGLTREKERIESDMYYVQEAQRMLTDPLYAKAFVMFMKTLPYYKEYEDDDG